MKFCGTAAFLLVLMVMASFLSGCISEQQKPPEKEKNKTNESGTKIPSDAEKLVSMAKTDLAGKIGVNESAISVVEVTAVEWPDTSLGYPEKGKFYAQVITPGYKIVLESGARLYEYHSDLNRVIAPPDLGK